MIKRWTGALVAMALLLAAPGALALTYSFPLEGISLAARDGWTVLTPQTLEGSGELLAQLGADEAALRADWAAYGTLFEVYLPDHVQVRLNATQTAATAAWGEMARMGEADMAQLLAGYSRAPYENATWAADLPGYIRCDWTMQAGGIPVSFAGLITVRQGTLYTLMASGASVGADDLHAANAAVLQAITFLGAALPDAQGDTAAPAVPDPVADDGTVTPIELVDFDGITYEDATLITVRTLPGAELTLRTSGDSLRGRAGEDGLHRYEVSTRRTTVYDYTLSAQAEGRQASTISLSLQRRLTAEQEAEAFRSATRGINAIGGYNALREGGFAGEAVTFRGSVGEVRDIGGFLAALVYTDNPRTGVWQSPVWVLLTEAVTLRAGDICTVYGEIRGDTLPYEDADGIEQFAPVVISRSVQP